TTLGKIIGGGLPVGAFGGREDLMRQVAPDGPVYQAGTLSGNPLAMAAGLATLTRLREHPEVYDELERTGARLSRGLKKVVEDGGYPLSWNRVGSMATLFFTPEPVTGWGTSSQQDREKFGAYFHGMLDRGIYLPPSPFEALFLSAALTDEDIDRTVDAAADVLGEVFG
ncbi:MAG: aminotransferase class III-fold pyridoxal phosphate-dependent enzyme, partial [Candidatus Longimicrobiales bacterium M2_2A_002]